MASSDLQFLDTLLRKLSDQDYIDLINQEKLRHEGYKIHYVIDANIIQNFCYPWGLPVHKLKDGRTILTEEYINDEQVTIQTLLRVNEGDERVILFDEYSPEFQGMIREGIRLGNEQAKKEDLLDGNEIMNSNFEVFKEYVRNHFSRCTARVTLNIDALTKAKQLFTDKLILFAAREFKNEFLEEVATMCPGSDELSNKIYQIAEDHIWKSRKGELHTSKHRDSVIIDRILSFNRYVHDHGKGEDSKHLFILFTDSEKDKDVINSLRKREDIPYPSINGSKVSLVRNTSQYFAYLISAGITQEGTVDTQQTLENLEKLRKVSLELVDELNEIDHMILGVVRPDQKENKQHYAKRVRQQSIAHRLNFSDDTSRTLVNNYRNLRNQFENSGLLKSFPSLYDTFKKDAYNQEAPNLRRVLQRIHENYKALTADLVENQFALLSNLKEEAKFTITFYRSIELIRKGKLHFDLSKGHDHIEGSYQHLPVFLTFALKETRLRQTFINFIKLVFFDKHLDEGTAIINQLESTYLKHLKDIQPGSEGRFEIKLMKAFIFLILPSDYEPNSFIRTNDRYAYEWLNLMEGPSELNPDLTLDNLYLKCWVYRRLGKYKESIEIAEQGIEYDETDPRFHHGKLLARFCLILDKEFHFDMFDVILEDLERVHQLYPSFLNHRFSAEEAHHFQQKITDTYNNTSCYTLSLKAIFLIDEKVEEYAKLENTLIQARSHLQALRPHGVYRDNFPEYYDTEATLELVESYVFDNKVAKIKNALRAINKAIQLNDNPSQAQTYYQRKQSIKNRLDSLQGAKRP